MANVERFGKLESEQITEETLMCRDIVSEILRFGVNQRQLVTIIRLIALELEDLEKCREIVGVLQSFDEISRVTDLADDVEEAI